MAADFDAGSIEGTLDLDTTPFVAGLRRAREDAARFERTDINPNLGLNDEQFDRSRTRANVDLDRLGSRTVTPRADLDISEALAKYALLNKVLDAGGLGKASVNPGLLVGKFTLIAGGLLSVAAAAGPATAAIVGFGAAAGVAFAGVGVSLGLFAASVKSAFGVIQKANEEGRTLTGWAGKAQAALKSLTGAWDKLQKTVRPEMFKFLSAAFTGIAGVLPKLAPLLKTVAGGMTDVVKQVFALTRTPLFEKFLKQLQAFMHGFLSGLGPVLTNALKTFMHLFSALQPLMSMLGHGILAASGAVEKFSANLDNGGIKPFVAYLRQWLPRLGGLVMDFAHALGQIGKGIAPLAGPAINFIRALVRAIGSLNLKPFASAFGDVLHALKPFLSVIVALINTALKPFSRLLSSLADNVVGPLGKALKSELQPAFKTLGHILDTLVDPLSRFIGSIANLVNPTGVSLLTTLLGILSGIVDRTAKPFADLAVALESVIDTGIETILPVLRQMTPVFNGAASAAGGLAEGLAGILAHKGVALTLLGIVAAVKAYKLAVVGVAAVQRAWAATTAIIEAVQFGWAGLTVAQDANTASVIANKVAMIAWKGTQIAAAAASKVFAAGQWLVNAALSANPIGLVVIAIAALVAGLIYAYKHSETFRKIVNAAFHAVAATAKAVFNWLSNAVGNVVDFIRNHWKLLLSIMTGPIGAAAIFVISHFGQIKNFITSTISGIVGTVRSGLDNVFGFFSGLPGRIMGLAGRFLSAGKDLMQHVFSGLESAASAAGSFASGIASAIWEDLKSVLNSILPHSISINKGPIHLSVPLFPYLATGGVTSGPMAAVIGDNPGGREAVIPLDKYDIPKKGERTKAEHETRAGLDALRRATEATNDLLRAILGKTGSPDELADVLKHLTDAQLRSMIQIARAS